ncbi:hypothetical protein [Halorussus litoreus]|uniref:hypothetical protein n=1 Tax=Halorussus litoreus TaxID=1710536 RepID=UPI000E221683|nr:hypothetical protein [Halorussus litoreus]
MGVRSALGTMARFVAAVSGLYFVVALGLLLVVFAGRALGGQYPVPDESVAPLADVATLVATLLAAWFLVESYSLKRLFAFAVAVWALFFAVLLSAAAVDAVFGPLSVGWPVFGVLLLATGVLAYLGAYRLIYPDAFARRTRTYGLGG